MHYLLNKGYQVLLVCHPGSEYERRAARDGIRTVPIPMRRGSVALAVPRLARLVRRERVDVIDAHGGIDHEIAALAGQLSGRPVIARTKHKNSQLHGGFFSRVMYRRPLTHKIVAISDAVRRQLRPSAQPDRTDP